MSVELNLSLAEFNAEMQGNVEDTADQSARLQQIENETALRQHRLKFQREAQDIDADGTVWCKGDCGGKVPPERLAILPLAAYCVDCLDIIEQQDKPMRIGK